MVNSGGVLDAGEGVGETAGTSVSADMVSPWKGARRHFLEWLETFRVVASTHHFTSAAAQLGYSQSTVTAHIKSLEEQLGVMLFERCRFSKNIVLTEAGSRALDYASRLLALASETKTAALDFYKAGELADTR